jgi:hypothetical protein
MTPRPSVSDFEMSSCHLSSLFLEIVDAHEGPHGLQAYSPARMTAIADLNAGWPPSRTGLGIGTPTYHP